MEFKVFVLVALLHVNGVGQLALGDGHRQQELLQQHFAGVGRLAVGQKVYHLLSLCTTQRSQLLLQFLARQLTVT